MYSSSSATRQPNRQQVPGGFDNYALSDEDFVDADEFLQGVPLNLKADAETPVLIGQSRGSQNSVAFHRLAQAKRIDAVFEFEEVGQQLFSAKLVFGKDHYEIVDQGPYPNKKTAKEAICGKGLTVLQSMEAVPASPEKWKVTGQPEKNWKGILAAFYQLEPETVPPPLFTDFQVGLDFACELFIEHRNNIPFGGRLVKFPNKKAARNNAAREAVEWLIQQKFLPPDGNVPKGKKRKSRGSSVSLTPGSTVVLNGEATYAQKVSELCPQLGLTAPEYVLKPADDAPSMYSGGAYFKNDPILPTRGPIGEIRNVFGKKNAKEECAKLVLEYLMQWAEGRRVALRFAAKEDE